MDTAEAFDFCKGPGRKAMSCSILKVRQEPVPALTQLTRCDSQCRELVVFRNTLNWQCIPDARLLCIGLRYDLVQTSMT